MKKRFSRASKTELVDLDITSLLDILVILLVFLLLNYNASDLDLNLVKGLKPADSESQKITHYAPVIQFNSLEIVYLDNKEIARFPAGEEEALNKIKVALEEKHASLPKDEKDTKEGALINLVFDRNTNFEKIEKIMQQSASVGFTQFKFIVKGTE